MAALELATAIVKAIDKIAEITAQVLSGAEVRKLKYRLEAATNYVEVDEKIGEYKDIDDDRQKKLKRHFRRRIFDI
jgi:hypothetical protein